MSPAIPSCYNNPDPIGSIVSRFNCSLLISTKGKKGMRDVCGLGAYKDIVEAPDPEDHHLMVKLGVTTNTFRLHATSSAIGQYYGIVQEGIILARHLFRGLNRPLLHEGDMNADQGVIVYTWRPLADYEWAGGRHSGRVERIDPPPPNRVFAVLVRLIESDHHGVVGSVEHWNWIREDPGLPHAPVDWEQRYTKRLWSRDT